MDSNSGNIETAHAGGRVMAECARTHDWAATPLGPAARWPQSLKTAVDLVLACDFPMIVLWGPQLIQIYNDGYRRIMADKHPTGLGQPTRECWPEAWHYNGPIYQRVRAGETVTLRDQLFPIVRHGPLEDAWFTLCYSPLRDEAGAVAGVLVTVFETTERVVADAARDEVEAELREGTARQAFLLRFSDAIRAEADADGVANLALRLLADELKVERCYVASLCMAAGRADVIHQFVRPGAPAVPGNLRLADFPAALRQIFTRTMAVDDVANDPDLSDVDKRSMAAMEFGALVAGVVRHGEGHPVWVVVAVSREPRHWSRAEIALVENVAERLWAAIEHARAETALRESEARYAGEAKTVCDLYAASRRTFAAPDLTSALAVILDSTIGLLAADFGSVQIYNHESAALEVAAQRGFPVPFLEAFRAVTSADETSCGRSIREARRVLVEDIERDAGYAPYREVLAAAECRAVQSTPLFDRQGALLGVISTHWREPHRPTDAELVKLDLYARQAVDAIVRARAEQRLRVSEEKYRTLFHSIDAGFCALELIRDAQGKAVDFRFVDHNPAMTALLHKTELIGKHCREVLPELDPKWLQLLDGVARCGGPVSVEQQEPTCEARWFDCHLSRVGGPDSRLVAVIANDITERKHAAKRMEVMIAELQHRTRNLIAVVCAISAQTLQTSATLEQFGEKFDGRMRSLADVQGLLSRSDKEPITIGALLRMELQALGAIAQDGRIKVEGPPVRIRNAIAQTLALGIHELAANARKYGALAAEDGLLKVCWHVNKSGDTRKLVIEWNEQGISARKRNPRHGGGYGRRLIEEALPHALQARTSYVLGGSKLQCRIELPLMPE